MPITKYVKNPEYRHLKLLTSNHFEICSREYEQITGNSWAGLKIMFLSFQGGYIILYHESNAESSKGQVSYQNMKHQESS
jgi:hypothetical protein